MIPLVSASIFTPEIISNSPAAAPTLSSESLEQSSPILNQELSSNTPVIEVLSKIFGFPVEKYWNDFSLHQTCELALFKVFCDFYTPSQAPSQNPEELPCSFSQLLYDLRISLDAPKKPVDSIKSYFSSKRAFFTYPTKVCNFVEDICGLLQLPNVSFKTLSPKPPSFRCRAQGLIYFAQLQNAAYKLSSSWREKVKKEAKHIVEEGFRNQNKIANIFNQNREQIKATLLDFIPPEELEEGIRAKEKANRFGGWIPFQAGVSLLNLLQKQDISIKERDTIEDLESPVHYAASQIIAKTRNAQNLEAKTQEKEILENKHLTDLVRFIFPQIVWFTKEPVFIDLFKELQLNMDCIGSCFWFRMREFFKTAKQEDLDNLNLEHLCVYIHLLDEHIFRGIPQEFEKKKKILSGVVSNYGLPKQLCEDLLAVAENASTEFEEKKQSLRKKYKFYFHFRKHASKCSSKHKAGDVLKHLLQELKDDNYMPGSTPKEILCWFFDRIFTDVYNQFDPEYFRLENFLPVESQSMDPETPSQQIRRKLSSLTSSLFANKIFLFGIVLSFFTYFNR